MIRFFSLYYNVRYHFLTQFFMFFHQVLGQKFLSGCCSLPHIMPFRHHIKVLCTIVEIFFENIKSFSPSINFLRDIANFNFYPLELCLTTNKNTKIFGRTLVIVFKKHGFCVIISGMWKNACRKSVHFWWQIHCNFTACSAVLIQELEISIELRL